MVHTATLFKKLSIIEVREIENRFKNNILLIENELNTKFKGITTKIICHKYNKKYQMEIHIDFIEMLEKADINESDYTRIEEEIEKFIFYVFQKNVQFILKRIDYRYDIALDESDRKVLLKIYKKSYNEFRQKRKNSKYDTSVYFRSGALELVMYDKEKEKEDKKKDVKEYEKNILRYEIRIKNRHLNYLKRKYGIAKELKNYFSMDIFKIYINKELLKFIFPGDHYKTYKAITVIKNSCLKDEEKKLLIDFLIDVSKYGITKTRELKCNKKLKYTEYKFKKALKLLQILDINPLLIPKNERNKSSVIENPFKFAYI